MATTTDSPLDGMGSGDEVPVGVSGGLTRRMSLGVLVGMAAAPGYCLQATNEANRASDSVTPEMFDGDLHKAAAYAALKGVTLVTPATTYVIDRAFAPHDITWISNGTRIRQTRRGTGGADPLDSGIFWGSNVRHSGRTYIDMVDTGTNAAAYRAHSLMGRMDTGEGPSNIVFGELVLEGGHYNINGFAVVGNTHNIRGERIQCGNSNKIGRLFIAHWGNFNDHNKPGSTYQHVAKGDPTTHPHDIKINEVFAGDLTCKASDFLAVVCVSAGYDIEIGEVRGNAFNSGTGGSSIVMIIAGDLGLAYASPDIREAGMRNIHIRKIVGRSNKVGYQLLGRALYFDKDSTPKPDEYYLAKIDNIVDYAEMSGAGTLIHEGVSGGNGNGRSHYGTLKLRNFRSAWSFPNYTRRVSVDYVDSADMQSVGLQFHQGSGTDQNIWPTDIYVKAARINGTGASETKAENYAGFIANKIHSLRIDSLIIDRLRENAIASGSIGPNASDVTINQIKLNWTSPKQRVVIKNSAGPNAHIAVGQIVGGRGLVPVSGGIT